ncbi:MAG TPA: 3-oxoacyl-[acyl-carrier-protein] reductase [Papillibacter sp.]|nr:3-oxoacyl-[acyl-carrier-protein] reductase [Papillibacter sp.]
MLKGKVALITGASRGIGRAIAMKLASLGADVALVYGGSRESALKVADIARQYGVRAEVFQCDVSDFEEAGKTVAAVKEAFGTIDILVNNAGITKDGLVLTMREDAFDSVLDVNLKGAFNMIRHTSPIFVRKRAGRIINIASVVGLMGNAGQANYAASKAGLIGLTKSVARELAARNVCCNAIAPGFIETDMTRELKDSSPLIKSIPLGRAGTPEEVAEVAAFLAQQSAGYITGEVIRIDGGLAM